MVLLIGLLFAYKLWSLKVKKGYAISNTDSYAKVSPQGNPRNVRAGFCNQTKLLIHLRDF